MVSAKREGPDRRACRTGVSPTRFCRRKEKQIPFAPAPPSRAPPPHDRWPPRGIRSTSLRSPPPQTAHTPKAAPSDRRRYTRREAATDSRIRENAHAPQFPVRRPATLALCGAVLRPQRPTAHSKVLLRQTPAKDRPAASTAAISHRKELPRPRPKLPNPRVRSPDPPRQIAASTSRCRRYTESA